MRFKKTLIFIVMLSLILVGCSSNNNNATENTGEDLDNLNETGMPIVKEPIKFDIFVNANSSDGDWNDILIWNEYQDMTNIEVEWEQVPHASLEEKRNLTLASDDLPDAFYATSISNLDLFKYGQQGTFLPLNDLIEEHAPNLMALMDEYPAIRQSITSPDDNIYAMPTIQDPDFLSLMVGARPWFNTEWLEELDMDLPETTDEFYDFLVAAKETELESVDNDRKVPYGGRHMNELIRWLRGSFGLSAQHNTYYDLGDGGDDLRFIPTSEDYKTMLEYINKLYEEKLINQNIFSIEGEQFLADGAEELYGATVFYGPDETFGTDVYTGGLALEGPNGDRSYSVSSLVGRVDGLVLTKENENPAAMIRWIDYFYTDEGARFQYMGIEGETYEVDEDGEYVYVDEIANNPDGLTFDQAVRKDLTWLGIWPPGIMKQEYFMGSETSDASLEATDRLEPHISDESWPRFMYTEEETSVLTSTGADVEKYVEEMRDKFISGDTPFTEWDNYVETLERMGSDKYMEVQQAAYDRYKENK